MELLDEIWRLIFAEYLYLVDTVRCRRVSKRFKFLVDQLGLTELFVYGHMPSICGSDGYRDDRNPSHWIQLYRLELEPNSSFQIVFANLRVLELDIVVGKTFKSGKEFNLELLNEFVRLEKLYLNTVVISRNQTLRLPSLRVLSLTLYSTEEYAECSARWKERIIYSRQPRLVLDSKVKRLLCYRTKLLVVKHPECIEFLECDGSDLETNPVTLFKNLRVLRSHLSKSMTNIFDVFEHLEELHLKPNIRTYGDEPQRRKKWINRLMGKRTDLRREVKIYFLDVCLPSDGSLDIRMDVPGNSLEGRIRNYHQLADRVRGEKRVYYGNLIYYLDELGEVLTRNRVELDEWRFPVGFFRKFLNIKCVWINTKVANEVRLLRFLGGCARLTQLFLCGQFLTQSLLDRLPAVCGPLKVLTIVNDSPSGLDPRPIYGLKQLFRLDFYSKDANLDSPLDLPTLFESCRYLVEVKLRHIRIIKTKLYYVYAPRECDLIKSTTRGLNYERAAFNYEDLKRNLGAIIEECKELRKRTRSHSIW